MDLISDANSVVSRKTLGTEITNLTQLNIMYVCSGFDESRYYQDDAHYQQGER